MPHTNHLDNYTTIGILPSVRNELNRVVNELKKTKRRGWSVTSIVNLACIELLPKFAYMSDEAEEEFFNKYQELKREDKKQK